jgi:hypothetical protein
MLQEGNNVGDGALLADVVLVARVECQVGKTPHHLVMICDKHTFESLGGKYGT